MCTALLSHQHHCPLDVSKTLKGTKAATFERQPHIGRHSCHHQDPLPYPSPTSLCPCPCQIMQGVTMLCALLLDVSCAEHIVYINSWCYVHPSTLYSCTHHILVLCAPKHTASWLAKNHQQQQHCCRVDWHGSKASAGAKKLLNRKQSFSVGNRPPSSFAVKSTD